MPALVPETSSSDQCDVEVGQSTDVSSALSIFNVPWWTVDIACNIRPKMAINRPELSILALNNHDRGGDGGTPGISDDTSETDESRASFYKAAHWHVHPSPLLSWLGHKTSRYNLGSCG